MIERIISIFENKRKILFYSTLLLCTVFAFLLFNLKISDGGDDSDYIYSAWQFLKGISFPTWHGSFYQILLSVFIWAFGLKIIILKLLSLALIVFHLFWLNKTFQNKIPPYILLLSLLFLAINANILVYASLTYSEALYFALQIICIYYSFQIIEKLQQNILVIKFWRDWLILGFFMFLLTNTRNIGISMVLAIVIYLIIYRKWLALIFSLVPYVVCQVLFIIYKNTHWKFSKVGFEDQFGVMFFIDPYNPSFGNESLKGFILRFFENTNQYISGHLFSFVGINIEQNSILSMIITISFTLFFCITLWKYIKSNKFFAFLGIYIVVALCATFISQQVLWNQPRLVLVYLPLILIFLLFKLHEFTIKRTNSIIKSLPFATLVLFILLSVLNTFTKVKENMPILINNIEGYKYYGFTEDWINYLKLSEWCGSNLPKEAIVGCRKPTMSFIYGNGPEYVGIYQFPTMPIDSFSTTIKRKSSIIAISIDDIMFKLPAEKQQIFRENLWSEVVIMKLKTMLGIIEVKPYNKDILISEINQYKLLHYYNADSLLYLANDKENYAVFPDSLLNILHSNKLDYLINAKINSGVMYKGKQMSLNSVLRYITFIRKKYPTLFELVRTEGKSNPASLYKIHWEKIVTK